jgi:hypothetical protein
MRWLTASLTIVLVTVTWAAAQEETQPGETSELTVTRAVIARAVEGREPVGEGTEFPPDVQELACFTKIEGTAEETVIYHTWRHGDEVKARVELSIRGSSWRTWSTKQILPHWTGEWSVKVEDADGNLLTIVSFTITES